MGVFASNLASNVGYDSQSVQNNTQNAQHVSQIIQNTTQMPANAAHVVQNASQTFALNATQSAQNQAQSVT